jgi:hypothetical protein
MRGTEIRTPSQLYTLHGGFKALEPFHEKPLGDGPPFEPTPDPMNRYSTGNLQLDAVTEGFRRGDTVLIRLGEGLPPLAPALLLAPIRANWMLGGRPVVMMPPGGTNPERVAKFDENYGITQAQMRRLLRITTPDPAAKAPYSLPITQHEDGRRHLKEEEQKLVEETGKPLLRIIYADSLDDLLPQGEHARWLDTKSRQTKDEGGLLIILTQPGSASERHACNISNTQLTLRNELGTFLLQGQQPKTQIYALEMEDGASYPKPRLTPMQ